MVLLLFQSFVRSRGGTELFFPGARNIVIAGIFPKPFLLQVWTLLIWECLSFFFETMEMTAIYQMDYVVFYSRNQREKLTFSSILEAMDVFVWICTFIFMVAVAVAATIFSSFNCDFHGFKRVWAITFFKYFWYSYQTFVSESLPKDTFQPIR